MRFCSSGTVLLSRESQLMIQDQLERVQRKFLRFENYVLKIFYSKHDYAPVINILGLPYLAERRHASGVLNQS